MAVRGVGFVGIRTGRLGEMARLFGEVFGMPVARRRPGLVGFAMADGTVLELCGPEDDFHDFFTTGPVVGFHVDDFDATRAAMLAAGLSFIGEVQEAGGSRWQHFRCPDGTVAEIIGPAGDAHG